MLKRSQMSMRWPLLATAAAFAAGFGLGRSIEPAATEKRAPSAAAPISSSGDAETAQRFQIPVTKSQPSQGPVDAMVTVVEWCDLEGAECERSAAIGKAVVSKYGDHVRLVFRHFAASTVTSNRLHEFARIAHERAGAFWELRDLLGREKNPADPANFERYAKAIALDWESTKKALESRTFVNHVAADRMFAEMFEVRSAPAFFVNGRRARGAVTAASLGRMIGEELAHANKLVAGGVPKERVYAELTKNGAWQRPTANAN
jgi:protein-disulfide isomerase